MNLPVFPNSKPSITEANIDAVSRSLKNPNFDCIKEFEEVIANYCGAKYAVAFSSGTAAKMAAYFAIELNKADRIITTPNLSVSTLCTPVSLKNRIHLIDIDLKNGMMDFDILPDKIKISATRGRTIVIPYHYMGTPSDVEAIDAMLSGPETIMIEDASQAFGGNYFDGSKVGSCTFSLMTLFDFSFDKILTTGRSGMITTNDEQISNKLKIFRNGGPIEPKIQDPDSCDYIGITCDHNLTPFQAALGISQFGDLESSIQKRRMLIKHYRKKLKGVKDLKFFESEFDDCSSPSLFIVRIDFPAWKTTREKVIGYLNDRGIEAKVPSPPLYLQSPLKYCLDNTIEYANMDLYFEQGLSLPLYTDLNEREIDQICDLLKSARR